MTGFALPEYVYLASFFVQKKENSDIFERERLFLAFSFQHQPYKMSSTLYVGNLTPEVGANDVRKLLSKYGRVVSVELKGGYAFVVSVILSFSARETNKLRYEFVCGSRKRGRARIACRG